MNEQEMNVAIAEACGWEFRKDVRKWATYEPRGTFFHDSPPNYTRDLNAMHEAERTLTFSQGIEYGRILHAVCDASSESPDFDLMAPAELRAEAFLRTIGKFTPTPTPTPT